MKRKPTKRKLVKAPAPALLDRIYKDALRACSRHRQSGTDLNTYNTYLRKVHVEYARLLDRHGIYVEHAGLPEVNTEAWRARDRADEMREVSWLTAIRKIA